MKGTIFNRARGEWHRDGSGRGRQLATVVLHYLGPLHKATKRGPEQLSVSRWAGIDRATYRTVTAHNDLCNTRRPDYFREGGPGLTVRAWGPAGRT